MSRFVLVDNQFDNTAIDVYVTPNNGAMYKLATLQPNHAIRWEIPNLQWSGNFKVGPGSNATLAEFTFNGFSNLDFYDISSIPPGCSGSATSYAQCVKQTGLSGWNVPLTIQPVGGSGTDCVTLTCSKPGCVQGFGYPNDTSKQRTCANTTSLYRVIFGNGTPASHHPRRIRTFRKSNVSDKNGKCLCPEDF